MDYEHPLDHPGDEPAPAFSARAFVRGRRAIFSYPSVAVFLEDSPDELTIFDERLWLALRNKLEPLDPLAALYVTAGCAQPALRRPRL